jgi:TRAP-type C4-dicarboxylate transport system permease large subunit
MIIGTPILVPALSKIGIDPIHFGVVFVINLLIGMMTPPFGISLFLVSGISGVSMKNLLRDLWPFLLAMLVLLGLLTYFPKIVLFLPNMLG